MVQTRDWIPKFPTFGNKREGIECLSHPSAMTCAPPSLCCWTCVCDHVTNSKQVPTAGPCGERGGTLPPSTYTRALLSSVFLVCVCVCVYQLSSSETLKNEVLSHFLSLPRDPSSTFWLNNFSSLIITIAPVTSSIVTTKNEKTRHSPPLCCCCCCCCYSLQDKGQKKKSCFEL